MTSETVITADHYLIRQTVKRSEHYGRTVFSIYEFNPENGEPLYVWDPHYHDQSPRPSIEVTVFHPHSAYGGTVRSGVGWPNTSDRRPALARALSAALTLAADEAEAEDRRWAAIKAEEFFCNRGDWDAANWKAKIAEYLKELIA